MKALKFFSVLALALAGIVMASPPAAAQTDVYVTEGTHVINGREWRTACVPYSQTKRCTTEIKATVVSWNGSGYVQTTGFVFNNLTYAAAPRSLWNNNPLGGNGVVGARLDWTASDGREWRTECDTALTGSGGCRSFIKAGVIEAYRTSSGSTAYRRVTKEIMNNMVRFTPGSATVSGAPSWVPCGAPDWSSKARSLSSGGLVYAAKCGNTLWVNFGFSEFTGLPMIDANCALTADRLISICATEEDIISMNNSGSHSVRTWADVIEHWSSR